MTPTGTVLVVEDDALLREMVELMLAGAGYRVATAPDGPTALALVETLAPSLILMDVSMPDMSGLEVLEILRRDRGWTGAVLIMTAHQDRTTAQRVVELGGDGYVAKPFSRDVLLERVGRALAAPDAG